MTQPVLSPWRATYVPGDWIVLAGPTSLVVIQPLAAEWSELITSLWQQVLASSSMVELAEQLVAHGIADMPSFGAFFWTDEGMRSLVRGGVVVRDLDNGRKIADGQGVQTWREVGLGDVDRISIETPRMNGTGMELPLLVGAAHAAALTLDASPAARVSSGQGTLGLAHGPGSELLAPGFGPASASAVEPDAAASGVEDSSGLPGAPATDSGAREGAAESPPPRRRPSPVVDTDGDLSSEGYLEVDGRFNRGGEPPTKGYDEDSVFEMENAATRAMPLPVKLVLSDGQQVDLDRTVRIGRAPSAEGNDEPEPKLVTVVSPNQDISRSHVEIRKRGELVVVTDLHSTNGTVLVPADTDVPSQRLPAGEAVAVPVGSLLELGDGVNVTIERLGQDA